MIVHHRRIKMASERDLLYMINFTRYSFIRKQREVRRRSDPFNDYDDDKFKERFRLTKLTVEKILELVCIDNF